MILAGHFRMIHPCHWRHVIVLLHLTVIAVIASTIGVGLVLGVSAVFGTLERSEWVLGSIPFLVFAVALHRIAQNWANADGAFTTMAVARVAGAATACRQACSRAKARGCSAIIIAIRRGT